MNSPFGIRGNENKNIGSNLKQRVTSTSLNGDSVSTHTPRSHVSFRTLRNAGIYVQ